LTLIKDSPPEVPAVEEVNKIEVLSILLENWVKLWKDDEEKA
jgi:hypothetical protein